MEYKLLVLVCKQMAVLWHAHNLIKSQMMVLFIIKHLYQAASGQTHHSLYLAYS